MKHWQPTLAVMLVLLLAACSAVPLRTMWQMARMGPDALLEVEPAEVRAAVMSDELFVGLEAMDEVTLRFMVQRQDDAEYDFRFRLVDHTAAERGQLPASDEGMDWRAYAMPEQEYEAFQSMQRQFAAWMEEERTSPSRLTINIHFGTPGEGGQGEVTDRDRFDTSRLDDPAVREVVEGWGERGVPLRVDVQLFAERGYFTLIRKTRLPFEMFDTGSGGDTQS